MPDTPAQQTEEEVVVDLRDPVLAGLLAWLIPGLGHMYQGRWAKGVLFMICILGTFLYGLFIGGGKVVYASFREGDVRYAYVCQVGAGLPALPALVQAYRVKQGKEPLFGGLMTPPQLPTRDDSTDELHEWHLKYNGYFELGTAFTMIAGLLNILAIYDAFAGPVIAQPKPNERAPPSKDTARE